MERYIPHEITSAEKQGFAAPDASWFKGESIDYVREMFHNGDARVYEFMDRSSTLDLVDDHLDGKKNRRLFIWSLMNLEHWCAKYLS